MQYVSVKTHIHNYLAKMHHFPTFAALLLALIIAHLIPSPQPFAFPSVGTYSYSRYRIRYQRPQDYYSRTIRVSSTDTQYTVRYLQFGSSYNFSIRAEVTLTRYCYSTLYGDYSDFVDATTMETGIFT